MPEERRVETMKMKTVSLRAVMAAAKASGMNTRTLEEIRAKLEGDVKDPVLPRDVAKKISKMCGRDSRCAVTYNRKLKHWRVYTFEGMQAKVAAMEKTNAGKKA
jgi:hypothetical protein